MAVVLISIMTYLINVPFGIWRSNVRRFSIKWFLAIHIPVAIAVFTRYMVDKDFHWAHIVLFIMLFTAGQYTGKIIYTKHKKSKAE